MNTPPPLVATPGPGLMGMPLCAAGVLLVMPPGRPTPISGVPHPVLRSYRVHDPRVIAPAVVSDRTVELADGVADIGAATVGERPGATPLCLPPVMLAPLFIFVLLKEFGLPPMVVLLTRGLDIGAASDLERETPSGRALTVVLARVSPPAGAATLGRPRARWVTLAVCAGAAGLIVLVV